MWGSDQQKREFGLLYPLFHGSQEERNYAKAIKVIKKCAETGYVPALCALGYAYFDGKGVRKDFKTSLDCYLRAAHEGYPSAE
jgi:TPR repeat protein